MVFFVLFQNPGTSKNIWDHDPRKGLKTDFLHQLSKIGEVFTYNQIFSNYLQFDKDNRDSFDSDYIFNLEDILFQNHCKWVYDQIKDVNDKYIPIGLEEGCHYANYFAHKYHDKCCGLFLIGNRRFTKENYLKSLDRGARMMEIYYGTGYEKFTGDNVNNDNLHYLLSKIKKDNNKKYMSMIGYYVGLTVRSQYDDIPKKMLVPTFIYNRITLSRDIALGHNLKDEKTKYVKNIQTENDAIMAHCITNMDKYDTDQLLIKNSTKGMVKSYYIANDDFNLFIYDDTKNDILDKISTFVEHHVNTNQVGGYDLYHTYLNYKNDYIKLKTKQ